jgi:hypothetical protein
MQARRVMFWKKHQTILQSCADLSNKCGAKVLVIVFFQFFGSLISLLSCFMYSVSSVCRMEWMMLVSLNRISLLRKGVA